MFNRLSASLKRAILVSTGATVAIIGYDMARGQENLDSYKYSRDAQQGKQISPVRVNLMDKNPDLVYLGSYLVNGQGGCNSCHTCPSYRGNNPFTSGGAGLGAGRPAPVNAANYLAGGTTFPGRGAPASGAVLAAPNLTPDSSGLPGGMTYDEFKRAMQDGMVSSKPGHVLQVMPWPVFRNLYENDLVAIYQYLSAIPSAQPGGTCTSPGQTAP
jgi:hypothetical protein